MRTRQLALRIALGIVLVVAVTAVVVWRTRPDWGRDAALLDGGRVAPLPATEIAPSSGLHTWDESESGAGELDLFGWLARAAEAQPTGAPGERSREAASAPNPADPGPAESPVDPELAPPIENLAPPASPAAMRAINVYLAAIAGSGENLSVLVVNKDTGDRMWVGVGESAFGYRVTYLTMKGGVLERGGRSYVLELGQGAVERERATSGAGEQAAPEEAAPAEEGPKTDEQRLIGTWKGSEPGGGDEQITITFSAGGGGSISVSEMGDMEAITIRWSLKAGKIEVAMSMPGMPQEEKQSLSYRFESDRVLYLSEPGGLDQIRFVKQ